MNVLSDEQTFFKKHHIDEAEFRRTGLKWEQLTDVFETYLTEMPQYKALDNYFSDCLRSVANVHSVITKLKDPERVIETLIRKKISNNRLEISANNYNEIVTDLLEIRVLYVFKEDWAAIHDYVTNKWVLHTKPVAYVCDGDAREKDGRDLLVSYGEKGCDICSQEYGYRAITYLAKSGIDNRTHFITILSRTIFEDGWNAIDQVIREFHDTDNPLLMQYLSHFSHRTSDMIDEMSSFLHNYLNKKPERRLPPDDGRKQHIEGAPRKDVASEPLYFVEMDKPATMPQSSHTQQQEASTQPLAQDTWQEQTPGLRSTVSDAQQDQYHEVNPLDPDSQQDPTATFQPTTLGIPVDEYPVDQESEQDISQKFTLSKLKHAIQGITPKNP